MNSLLFRVTAIVFACIAVVVIVVVAIVNYQVTDNFTSYVHMNNGSMMHSMHANMQALMGSPEKEFISSLKRLLLMLTGVMLLGGVAVSFYLARSITGPIRQLDRAAKMVAGGDLETHVPVTTRDEIGGLAAGFNTMTAKLKENDGLRRRFLAGVAHELRTPLTILKANLEGMRDRVIEPSPEHMGSLTEEVDRLAKLVGDLRDLSLLEAGYYRLEKSDVDINAVIKSVVAKFKPVAESQGVVIDFGPAPELPFIQVDSGRIIQMLDNLLINAIKYTPAGGRIYVKSALAGDKATINVVDEGAGIAGQDLPHIFDYFFRADPSRAKDSGGTGLGLAIVRQIAEAHGGSVSAESEPGRGSSFCISLPLKTHQISTPYPLNLHNP